MISTILIVIPHQPKKAHDGIKPKAEYLVVLTYDDHRNVDLDLWLHHEACTVYYQSRECQNISLDRDSLGYLSNLVINADGTRALSLNQEVIAIRAVMPGDYLTAVNYYGNHAPDTAATIDCTVELIKINPTVNVIRKVTLHFEREKQTFNAIAFHVEESGAVTLQPVPAEDLINMLAEAPQ